MDSIRGFQQLLVLAETGNYRKAASVLGITHSALSKTVSRAEDYYEAQLFVRDKQKTVPTAFGMRIIEAAKVAVGEFEDAAKDISLMRNLEAGRLNIGAHPAVCDGLLSTALVSMIERFPNLRFSVYTMNERQMVDQILSRQIDIFVGLAPNTQLPGIVYQNLKLGAPLAVCRAGHPALGMKGLKFEDLQEWAIIGTDVPDWFLEILRQNMPKKFPTLKSFRSLFLWTNSLALLRRILLKTDAIVLMPAPLIADDLKRKKVFPIYIEDLSMTDGLPGVMATLEGRPPPPAVSELAKCIRQVLRGEIPVTQKGVGSKPSQPKTGRRT